MGGLLFHDGRGGGERGVEEGDEGGGAGRTSSLVVVCSRVVVVIIISRRYPHCFAFRTYSFSLTLPFSNKLVANSMYIQSR